MGDVDVVFFFKQKTAYEMRISDWSSDVCSSDLYDPIVSGRRIHQHQSLAWLERRIVANERGLIAAQNLLPALAFGFLVQVQAHLRSWIVVREFHLVSGRAVRNLDAAELRLQPRRPIGRASRRERTCQYV